MTETDQSTDHAAIARALEVLGPDAPPSTAPPADGGGPPLDAEPPANRRPGSSVQLHPAVLLAGSIAVAVFVALVIARLMPRDAFEVKLGALPTSSTTTTAPAAPDVDEAPLLPAGGLVGRPAGSNSTQLGRTATPGQVLRAPEPTTGKAIAWSWQLCTDSAPKGCTTIDGTDDGRSIASPPTPRIQYLRAVVTVQLDDSTVVRAASPTVMALPSEDE